MTTVKVECSRCGKEEQMQRKNVNQDKIQAKLPENWRNVDIHHAGVVGDICGECWKDYQTVEEYFFEEKVQEELDLDNQGLQVNLGDKE